MQVLDLRPPRQNRMLTSGPESAGPRHVVCLLSVKRLPRWRVAVAIAALWLWLRLPALREGTIPWLPALQLLPHAVITGRRRHGEGSRPEAGQK
jgi:hypothetical protein